MSFKKFNAILGLVASVLLFDHTVSYTLYMLSGGSISALVTPFSWMLAACVLLHAVVSIASAIHAHKVRPSGQYKNYPRHNMRLNMQRNTGLLLLLLQGLHIWAAFMHFEPWPLHAVLQPLFFAVALGHTAISFSRSLISLGIGTPRTIRIADIVAAIVCAVLWVASTVGLYIHLFTGVIA